ncbi:alanine--tRNA ligase [Candidatus Moranella endobia]|uniref:Alanine--tRNA ligase n=1 Tax=Moranella endobia (strain PCIT) TaxID=903503 RepID=F7XXK0_MOREP|nr:alanine--tRNA ligase [Candidatus Moranella endobia]AEI74826.1 alanyl-tRNA synthetase [Candidatus Moranella endobia PCIT]
MSKSTTEIRQAFIEFFHSKKHQVVASSSLIPDRDPTLLFTNAGMNQFKDVFLGLDNRSYRRATTSQRCVRAGGKHNDLDNVGYTARHHTFFEMLGNFSFGDYFKHDAIRFAWELLTCKQWFNLPKDKLWVTVYATDDESYNIWANEVGIPAERIIRIGDNKVSPYMSDNFWQMGDTGPCGPCSEIFYDHGEHLQGSPPGKAEENGDRYIEIWNLVFMQFNRQTDGTLLPLPKPSVDTGMGLERIAAILQHVNSNYDIDLFKNLIDAVAQVVSTNDHDSKSLRVIADHIRSSAFLASDGIVPSNEGRGYVLRRIIRRAIRHSKMLGANDACLYKLVAPLIKCMGSTASQLQTKQKIVEQILRAEEEHFARTLERGLQLLEKELAKITGDALDGDIAFRLYDTYGFPLDLTTEVCRERNLRIDKKNFDSAMDKQRNRAHQASYFRANYKNMLLVDKTTCFCGYEKLEHQGRVTELFHDGKSVEVISQGIQAVVVLDETPFYGESGGQVGDSGKLKSTQGLFNVVDTQKYGNAVGHLGKLNYGELKIGAQVVAQVDGQRRTCIGRNHSATHLLHTALRQVLGEHIKQKGSLVNHKCLRFDFSHYEALKLEQLRIIENIVNEQIRSNMPIKADMMSLEEASNKGAIALFNEKYEATVRVINMGYFSTELCIGTHARRTGDIGFFRIMSEASIAAGIRRIEAVTGEEAMASLHQQSDFLQHISNILQCDSKMIVEKVQIIQERLRKLEKKLQQLENQQAAQASTTLSRKVRNINGVKVMVGIIDNVTSKILRTIVEDLKNKLGSAVIVLATTTDGKAILIAGVTTNLTDRIKAFDIVSHIAKQIGGKGGGRPDLAQAGGSNIAALPSALTSLDAILAAKL